MALPTDYVRSAHLPFVALLSPDDDNACTTRILENRREYGTKENNIQLLKACKKERHMHCWEALYTHVYRQKKVLIDELQISDTNPHSELAKVPYILCLELYTVQHTSSYRTRRSHTKRCKLHN